MSVELKSVGAITLFVADPSRSKGFYERVFDVPIVYEDDDGITFKFDNTLVNLLALRAAPELIEPGKVATGEDGSRLQLTIWVDDADTACSQLAERGITLLNGPIDREWGVRTACFADPDGHVWEVAQQLGG
jgi:lactoylglutathione lyase